MMITISKGKNHRKIWKLSRNVFYLTALIFITYFLFVPEQAYSKENNTASNLRSYATTYVNSSKIKLNKTSATFAKGITYQLKIKGTKSKVTWSSSNKRVVTVSSKGTVKTIRNGYATITAKVNGKTLRCRITVVSPKISSTSLSIIKGQDTKLKITGTKSKVTWSSSNKKVASVSSKGTVKAIKKGSATISAKVNGKTFKCKITVIDPKINKTSVSLIKGYSKKLEITGTKRKVTWSSSNRKVATVSSKGTVKGIGKGTATITAKIKGKTFKCKVVIETPKITKTSLSLKKDKSYSLSVSGTKQKVTWSSSNKKVATVSSKGTVKGIGKGTATISAKVGSKTYTCKVSVYLPPTISINKSSATLERDKTLQLSMLNTSSVVEWSSSNKKIASVSSKGVVTGNMTGTATITAKVSGKSYTCKVTVIANKEYRRIEKYLVESINEKRKEKGLKPLIYVTSGLMEEYTELYYNDYTDEAFKISNGNKFSTTSTGSMFLIGLKDATNRNRILLEHPEFYDDSYSYITAYTEKRNNDYNFINFELILEY